MQSRAHFRRLLHFVRPYSGRMLLAILLMAVVGVGEATTALMIKPVVDRVLDPHAPDSRLALLDRKSTRLNSSHIQKSRMPSSA